MSHRQISIRAQKSSRVAKKLEILRIWLKDRWIL